MTHDTDVKGALAQARALGLDRTDAQVLLLHVLKRPLHDRAWLIAHDTDALPAPACETFHNLCQRRRQGEPVAYLVGQREFHGLMLQVDARVLDPRPDTETLVDWALDCLQNLPAPKVLDLGTGSGAIALAIQHRRPDAQVWALDASTDALDVARANALRLQLPVHFVQGHWLQSWSVNPERFDLIVSNPPYIRADDPHLAALTHEPLSALASGPDGLDDIRQIVAQAPMRLSPQGWLLLEHGWDQAADVAQLLQSHGYLNVQHRQDLQGIDRCTGGQIA